jgi:multidrug efflux pump subunit AcrA (membrane-fusion protein)
VRVRIGASGAIRLTALPDVSLRGTVVFVSPAVDPTTSLGVVRATIDEPPAGIALKLGLTGDLTLEVGGRGDVVLVPASALRRSADGAQEVVVCSAETGGSIARVREVEVGARMGDDAEMVSGVRAGERVVTRHVLGLEDGAPIAVGAAAASPGDSP